MRSLYDKEYLDSGCTLEYDEASDHDTTIATYVTNFIIAIVCLLAAGIIALSTRSYLMPAFFIFAALAYGIGGLNHVILQGRDDPAYDPLIIVIIACKSISTSFLVMVYLNYFTSNKAILWSVLVVSTAAIITFGIVTMSYIVVGVYQICALLFMSIFTSIEAFASCRAPKLNIMKAISGLIMIAGMLVQVLLSGTCGRGGYQDCFKDCPLPQEFNHNALFHVLYLIGVMGFGWAEYRLPSNGSKSEENE